MTPHVSVLLPVFNAEATLDRALESVRRQSLGDWELIAVDDGSTDGSRGILESASKEDSRIKVHPVSHGGLVPTLNLAITHSSAPLLARMDADDTCHPDRLRIQVEHLEANPAIGLVASRVRFGGDRTKAVGYAHYVDWTNTILSHEEIWLNRFVESPLAHPSVVFRRDMVACHGGYSNRDWPEDYELWLRWLEAGVRMEKRPEELLVWNDPPERLSRDHPRYRVDAFYACKCHYLARWMNENIPPNRPRVLWGAGRITRKRFETLVGFGVVIAGYIDISPRKIGTSIGGMPVHAPADIPTDEKWFIVSAVGNRDARDPIRTELIGRGYVEGRDFIMAA